MECIIPAANFKVISKAIQALSRLGDELCLVARQTHLSFIVINMSKTAVVTYDFFDVFFSNYSVDNVLLETDGCTCKLSMKTIARIFRTNKEKRVELCKIEYSINAANVTIKIKYKQEVTMTHIVKLIECNHANVTVPDSDMNQLSAPSSFYNQILIMFQHNDEDISWDVNKNKAIARNYNGGMQNSLKTIRTQVTLNAGEFTTYKVQEDEEITFSLRPFRAAINFADALHLNVTIKFSKPGKPAILLIKTSTFEATFLLATLNAEGVSQSTVSSAVAVPSNNKNFDYVEEERNEDVDGMDWDDDFDVVPESPRTKKAKIVFGRCYEPTFHQTMLDLGEVLAENSDSDSN